MFYLEIVSKYEAFKKKIIYILCSEYVNSYRNSTAVEDLRKHRIILNCFILTRVSFFGIYILIAKICDIYLSYKNEHYEHIYCSYGEAPPSININITPQAKTEDTSRNASGSDVCNDDVVDRDVLRPLSTASNKLTDVGAYEDWFGSEIMVPRGDRILEQFVVMLLRIAAYLKNDGTESINSQMFNSALTATWATRENIEAMPTDITDTPPLVGNKGQTPSYLRNYPQIFMKKLGTEAPQTDRKMIQTKNAESVTVQRRLRTLSSKSNKSYNSNETTSLESKRIVSDTIINLSSKSSVSKELRQKSKISEEATYNVIPPTKERGPDYNGESLNNHAVKNVKQIIEEIFDIVLEQVLNENNVVYEKLIVEKPSSSDEYSDKNQEMIQCCSKFINSASDTPAQCKTEAITYIEEIKYPINKRSVQIRIASNIDNNTLDDNKTENNEIINDKSGIATTRNIENITPKAVNSVKSAKSDELYTADKENISLDNINTLKLSMTNNDYSENLAITDRIENIIPNATDDIKDTKTEELHVTNNLKSIHSCISYTENKYIVNDDYTVAAGLAIINNKENVESNNAINSDKLSIVNHFENNTLDRKNKKDVDGISADTTAILDTSGKSVNAQNNNADNVTMPNSNTENKGNVECNSIDTLRFSTTEHKEKITPNETDDNNITNLDESFVPMHVETVSLQNTNIENKEIVKSNIVDTSVLPTNNFEQDITPNKADNTKNTNNDSNMERKETINADPTDISEPADTNRLENNTSNVSDSKRQPS